MHYLTHWKHFVHIRQLFIVLSVILPTILNTFKSNQWEKVCNIPLFLLKHFLRELHPSENVLVNSIWYLPDNPTIRNLGPTTALEPNKLPSLVSGIGGHGC